MKQICLLLVMSALLISCNQSPTQAPQHKTAPESVKSEPAAQDRLNQFVSIDMDVDLSVLDDSEMQVMKKLIQVGQILDEVYLRQVYEDNPKVRAEIAASNHADKQALLDLFDLHMGPWDTLDGDHPLWQGLERPAGAGVYPVDMTKEEFTSWIEAHPEDEEAFKSPYTVIRRQDDKLVAIPYSRYYADELQACAELMLEAAAITKEESMRLFLEKRAKSFLSDDYRDSEMAWMDLDGKLETAIGPYETYTDGLFGTKTFFEAFITIRNPADSAKLNVYKKYLRDMELNLPIPDEHKNLKRGSESPIAVVDQVFGGGDARPGVQATAFNLPNDEVVREQKGSKKVMLKNVLNAKFNAIMQPIANVIMDPEQRGLLQQKYFFNETLFHELSHGLGPGIITKDGEQVPVAEALQENYSRTEEGKADVMGAYNILFLMEKGEFPKEEKPNFLATYFAGLFRSMRFGIHESHGAGAAFQYNFFKEKGAFTFDQDKGTFKVDFAVLEIAIRDLVHDICMIQARGDYDQAKAFLEKYAVLADEVAQVNKRLESIPIDIKPNYPNVVDPTSH